jgi:hypothetical protein
LRDSKSYGAARVALGKARVAAVDYKPIADFWGCLMYRLEGRNLKANDCFAAAGIDEELTPLDLLIFNTGLPIQTVRAAQYLATSAAPSEPMSWGVFGQIAPPPPNPPVPLLPYDAALAQRLIALSETNLAAQVAALQTPLASVPPPER